MCQSRLEADRFISGTTLSANILYLFIYFLFIMAHKCKCNDLWYDDNILRVFIFYSLSTRGHSAKFRVGTNLLIQAESAEHKWVNEKVHKQLCFCFLCLKKQKISADILKYQIFKSPNICIGPKYLVSVRQSRYTCCPWIASTSLLAVLVSLKKYILIKKHHSSYL